MTSGPEQVQVACEQAVQALTDGLNPGAVTGSRAQWARAAAAAQRVIDTATAVQDAAIARLAAIEPEYREDGTEVECHRGLGHVALDTPAILSGVLAVSAVHAQARVRTAVRLAADGPAGSVTQSGLGGLHTAMAAGRLDAYRASVVAEELEAAPAPVAACVVAALEEHFDVEEAALLRRRCRRVLARISPDLLRQRAQRARAACGLRRWADEPGVDRWEGTFPSEEAAQAWAAIDALAQRYVITGQCTGIERARGTALTDLVAGNATINTVLTLTVPATALPDPGDPPGTDTTEAAQPAPRSSPDDIAHDEPDVQAKSSTDAGTTGHGATAGRDDLVEVTGPHGNQPMLVSRAWVTQLAGLGRSAGAGSPTVQVAPCHPVTGALLNPDSWLDSKARLELGARRDDLTRPDSAAGNPTRAETLPPRTGAGPAEAPTGAPAGVDAYRPSKRLAQHVRARDRRCRFPGCTIAAVFCDLDHVRPWPTGPTTDTNLICLCRRHHRVKQRPGWHATLTTDGVLTWTDPTGRVRTTHPADALTCTILTGTPSPAGIPDPARTRDPVGADPPHPHSRTRTALSDGPHSAMDFHLEHHTATPRGHPPVPTRWVDDHGYGHRTELTPPATTVLIDPHAPWPHRRTRPNRRHHDHDPPPF